MSAPHRLISIALFLGAAFTSLERTSAKPKAAGTTLSVWCENNGFFVTTEQMRKNPAWNETLEDPPLSAEDAAKTAEAFVQTKGFGPAKCTSIALRRLGDEPHKWYYAISFGGAMDQNLTHSPYGVVVMLMNKEMIAPVPQNLLPH
ncbi:hypothetical protein BH09VER1_BH09VER1_02430 [soil metagenome]